MNKSICCNSPIIIETQIHNKSYLKHLIVSKSIIKYSEVWKCLRKAIEVLGKRLEGEWAQTEPDISKQTHKIGKWCVLLWECNKWTNFKCVREVWVVTDGWLKGKNRKKEDGREARSAVEKQALTDAVENYHDKQARNVRKNFVNLKW